MIDIHIGNYIEQDRWDYSNECNKWEGGEIKNNDNPKQNKMLENYVVMTELEMMKWQIYFSHGTERTHRTIHVGKTVRKPS
jgi:hypothetical protein